MRPPQEARLFDLPPTEVEFFRINLSADPEHPVPFYLKEPKDCICAGDPKPTPINYITENCILIVPGNSEDVFSEQTRHTKECVYAQITGLKQPDKKQYNGYSYFIDKGHAVRDLKEQSCQEQTDIFTGKSLQEIRNMYDPDDEFPF